MSNTKDDFSQNLLASTLTPQSAAEKIPIIARGAVSDRAKETLNLVSTLECLVGPLGGWTKYGDTGREVC